MSTALARPPAARPPAPPVNPLARRPAWRRALRGPESDPAWARPALLTLIGATALLYLWGLGASGWANSFYAAAVQAGTKSWKAFFFGSSDAANFITVDKPPAALWVMGLSARIFGVNAWSILVPQALEGVAAVGVLYLAVKRWFGPAAGLLAGLVIALTPVAALMFRFNNPDALLVLLLTLAAYATVRATEQASWRWLAFAGALVGFGFLTKMLQTVLVVPGFGAAYLLAAPATFKKRLAHLAMSAGALVASALWWVAIVMAIPAADRPYIGGSQNNSVWNLMFGYNGFGRLTGNEAGSVGGAGPAGSRWGPTGLLRLFNADFGAQASWLIPAALILAAAALVVAGRARRTDRTRAAVVLWGGWLVVTGLAFSLAQGIIHPYYTVALAPAIGALVGIGAVLLWQRRQHWAARLGLGAALAAAALWAYVLLARAPAWHPALGDAVAMGGLMVAVLLVGWTHLLRRGAVALALVGVVVGLLGPGAYTLATAATTHSGAIPSAGPAGSGAFGPGPGGFRTGGPNPGGSSGQGGPGGILGSSAPSAALTQALEHGASRFEWVAAVADSNQAAGYQLATGDPVLAIGGFNGTDHAPTLAQFKALVAEGRIHYYLAGTEGGPGVGPGGQGSTNTPDTSSAQIGSWVASTFTASTVGGVTLYDLT